MRTLVVAVAVGLFASPINAQTNNNANPFVWPSVDRTAIPDARIASDLRDARDTAREAKTRADHGHRIARHAKRRNAVRNFVGANSHPVTIAAGTVMRATRYNGESREMLGTISYPNGASMIGYFGDGTGVYHPSPESVLNEFAGWVYGATTANPTIMEGVATFRNGDHFSGDFGTGEGIYTSANGNVRFVGKIDFDSYPIRPLNGIVETRHGKLLAILNIDDR